MPVRIPWHRRLEARALMAVAMVAGISLASLAVVAGRVVESHSIARAREELTAAHSAFTHLIESRSDLVAAQTRLITALPVFRAYFTNQELVSDAATMQAMADMFRQDLQAGFTIVSDAKGRWLASSGLAQDSSRSLIEPHVAVTVNGRSSRAIVALDQGLYLVVAEPALFADEVLGALTTGYLLDDTLAQALARTTHRDIALVTDRHVVSGTSLTGAERKGLGGLLAQHPAHVDGTATVELRPLGDNRYISGAFALGSTAEFAAEGTLILLEDWKPTQQFIDDIRMQLLWTGAAVFSIALIASVVVSRRISHPLRQLADVAGQIAGGHWEHRVSAGGSAEAAAMADAFNNMTVSLSHWHEEARNRAEQLQGAYDRFYAVTQSANDAIISTHANGAITFWNRSAGVIFGIDEEDAIGRHFASLLASGSRAQYDAAAASVAATAAGAPQALTLEAEGLRPDRSTVSIELSLTSWQSDGETSVTVIVRDVTDRRRAEALIRLRDQQLLQAQKMEAIGRLASGVAHDFNNSLAVIQGQGELLLSAMSADDPRRSDLEVMVQASEGAAAVTRRLLAFGRTSTGESVRVIDAGEVVTGFQRMLRRLLGEQVNMMMEAVPEPAHVRIDPGQLEQALLNLALNARDAMPAGGDLRIDVRNTTMTDPAICHRVGLSSGEYVTIAVRDSGCGMDRETVARVFEPFFTTKEPGQGTGLGLSMVYSTITQAGGAIEIDSEPGRGTTFLLHLPRITTRAVAAIATAAAPQRGSETILLVEDQRPIRALLTQHLKRAGYVVLAASSADEAMAMAAAHAGAIDLLLTDVMLHGTGGFDLSTRITSTRPGTKVLFITGYGPGAVERQSIDAAGLPCLQKPFPLDVLARQLRATIDEAKAA